MAHSFREHNPDQVYLLPPSPADWMEKEHKAFYVRDIVASLDLAEFTRAYSTDGRGAPAFSPGMLLSVVVYGWMRGVYSCRKLARLCRDDIGGRYLTGEQQPDFRSLNRFRLRHATALEALFLQSVRLCQEAGLVPLSQVSVDGTRMASFAAKRRNIKYGKIDEEMVRREEEMERHREYLRQAMEQADREDAAEDALYGEDQEGPPVPEAMKSSAGRLALLHKAKAALEAEAKSQAEAQLEQWGKTPSSERPHRKKPDPQTAVPKETAQYNPVDPQSRVQYSCQSGYLQGYNAQVAVDASSQVIVACDLVSSPTDVNLLPALLDQVLANTKPEPKAAEPKAAEPKAAEPKAAEPKAAEPKAAEPKPTEVLADGGYYSAENVTAIEERGMTALIPPPLKDGEKQRWKEKLLSLTPEGACALAGKEQMLYRLSRPEGKAAYRIRRLSVEPVFGQLKGSPGDSQFRRFVRLTLAKCRQDWLLLCSVHNFSKYLGWKAACQGA